MRLRPSIVIAADSSNSDQFELIKKVKGAISQASQGTEIDLHKIVAEHIRLKDLKLDMNKMSKGVISVLNKVRADQNLSQILTGDEIEIPDADLYEYFNSEDEVVGDWDYVNIPVEYLPGGDYKIQEKIPKIKIGDQVIQEEEEEEVKTERIKYGSHSSTSKNQSNPNSEDSQEEEPMIDEIMGNGPPNNYSNSRPPTISFLDNYSLPGRGYRKTELNTVKSYLLKNRDIGNPTIKCVEIKSKIFKNLDRLSITQLESLEIPLAILELPAKLAAILTIPPTSRKDANSFRMMSWPFFGTLFTFYVLSFGTIFHSFWNILSVLMLAVVV